MSKNGRQGRKAEERHCPGPYAALPSPACAFLGPLEGLLLSLCRNVIPSVLSPHPEDLASSLFRSMQKRRTRHRYAPFVFVASVKGSVLQDQFPNGTDDVRRPQAHQFA